MIPANLNKFLHARIPLSAHMGMKVLLLEQGRVQIYLPSAVNLNPHSGVFGGSLSALGLVSGWSLVYCALEQSGLPCKLVGQRSECEFLRPATGDCISETLCDAQSLQTFINSFKEKQMARLILSTSIRVGNFEVALHHGTYVALPE